MASQIDYALVGDSPTVSNISQKYCDKVQVIAKSIPHFNGTTPKMMKDAPYVRADLEMNPASWPNTIAVLLAIRQLSFRIW